MKVTAIGQAGLLIRSEDLTIIVDPYLSNSVEKKNPKSYRRIPICEELFDISPDVMIFTHDHIDHYDPDTVKRFIKDTSHITVLAPSSVWHKVRELGGNNNYVEFNRHTEWTEGDVCFTAVKAAHSDTYAIGVIIDDGKKKYYITGDTLYNTEIFSDIPSDVYAIFLPINGVGNNMNATDAARFAERVGANVAIPLHVGMFDELTPEIFVSKNRLILDTYKETEV